MAEHGWKHGDVLRHGTLVGLWRSDGRSHGLQWADGSFSPTKDLDLDLTRTLLVIDPADREQVERLTRLFMQGESGNYLGNDDDMQRALRAMLAPPKPPKPEEPLGLGAVVKCDPGIYERAWAVRVWACDDFGGKAWDWYDSSGNGGRCHYADIPAVEVLSQGVTP
jgi:hypothetical protein